MMRPIFFAAATCAIVLGPLARVPASQALQGAVAAAPTRAAAGVAVAPDYVIGADDVLSIMFWRDKDLSAPEVVVRPDGMVTLPLLNDVQAAGRTPEQLGNAIREAARKYVEDPNPTVIVKEIKSRPVYFVGGFAKPGVLQLTGDLTLLQAISLMGGVLPEADGEKGFLLRRDRKMPIDFDRLAQRGDLSQNPKLEPGDSVVVPLADSVYVSGEVKKPGAVKFAGDLTLLKALTQAGGLTPLAAGSRVDIIRGDPEKKSRIRVDVDRIMRSPAGNQDVRLRPNDIITVPQRRF